MEELSKSRKCYGTLYDIRCFVDSMGGALAVHVAYRELIPSLIGLAVIDVVEGEKSHKNTTKSLKLICQKYMQVFLTMV